VRQVAATSRRPTRWWPPLANAPPLLPTGAVDVEITADNAYSFGHGDAAGITHFTQGARALTAGPAAKFCSLTNETSRFTKPYGFS
jgi:hypothetical protein